MQSVLVYGRLFSRAVANGIYSVTTGGQATAPPQTSSTASAPSTGVEVDAFATASNNRKKLRFLTAVSGFPKNRTLEKVKPGKFGDDAFFVVKHAHGDVIGEYFMVYLRVRPAHRLCTINSLTVATSVFGYYSRIIPVSL